MIESGKLVRYEEEEEGEEKDEKRKGKKEWGEKEGGWVRSRRRRQATLETGKTLLCALDKTVFKCSPSV